MIYAHFVPGLPLTAESGYQDAAEIWTIRHLRSQRLYSYLKASHYLIPHSIGAIAGDAGKGAAIGATIGGLGGAVRQCRETQTQQSIASQTEAQKQQAMQKYEKAYGACLTGRGYAVQ